MNVLRGILCALVGLAISLPASAQSRPARILVGFPAGGESDVIARLVADRMSTSLGAPVIVENRPGANGMIAAEALKNAAPDGRTLMVSPIAITVFAPLTFSKLKYDPINDFAPVSLAAHFHMALAVGPASPAKTVGDYVKWVRTNPAKATYGVPLAGGPTHFLGVMFARATDLDLTVVPYKGSAPLVTDLIGGQVPAAISVLSQLLAHHEAGKLRVLATSGSQRSPMAPNVPTFKELGFAAVEGTGWQAFHTRAGTPRDTIDRLSAAIASAIRSPEISARLHALGLEPVGSTPDELSSRIAEDIARWTAIVKASGFRADE
ncbi:MAG: Bug family tripartite tricarboxylate transporter substrate binding protein [Rhodospirillaceae bacterium]